MPDWGTMFHLTIGGHMATAQSWSVGLNMGLNISGSALTQTQTDACLAAMQAPITTWWTALKVRQAADVQWDNSALFWYPSGQRLAALVSRVASGAVVGTAGGIQPLPVCMVASLRSTTPGRSGRGRSYIPMTGTGVSTGHQFTLADCTAVANAHAALIIALRGLVLTAQTVTAQNPGINSVKNGALYPITRVVCDSIPDFQDRRQDKIAASSVFSAPS